MSWHWLCLSLLLLVGGGSGRGTHVNPWLIHVNVWQKPLQYYKVISLQLIKVTGGGKSLLLLIGIKRKENDDIWFSYFFLFYILL